MRSQVKAYRIQRLGLWLALLAAFAATRLIGVGGFPPFIDEGVHLTFVERLVRISPLADAGEGRLFTLYGLWLFAPHQAGGIVLARLALALAQVFGFACLVGAGRLAGGVWGGALAGVLGLFSPYHLFFSRLALADPLAAVGVIAAVAFALRLRVRVRRADAVWCGVALFVAVGAKVSALPYLGLPAAALLIAPARLNRARWLWAATALGVAAGLTAALVIGVRLLGYDLLGLITFHNAGAAAPLPARLIAHAGLTLERLAAYWGLPLALIAAAAGLWLARRQPFLTLCWLLPLIIFWLNQQQASRLLFPAALLLLLSMAAALSAAAERGRAGRAAVIGLAALWVGAVGWPFMWAALTTPRALPLPDFDRAEYVTSDSSGYGLSETLVALQAAGAERAVGLLANCHGLRYLALGSGVEVECPAIDPSGAGRASLAALLDERLRTGSFAVVETSPYLPDAIGRTPLLWIPLPVERPALALYAPGPATARAGARFRQDLTH